MTNEQKALIRTYRLQGSGYKRIAKELHLTVDQVQRYCRKNGLAGPGQLVALNLSVWYEQNMRCKVCGKKLKQPARGRKRHFCSGRCRTAYYRQAKEKQTGNLLERLFSDSTAMPDASAFGSTTRG